MHGVGLAFEDICDTRDPHLLKGDKKGQWFVFYSRCDSWTGQLSGVAFRESKDDLMSWSSQATMVLVLDLKLQPEYALSTYAAHSESPFLFFGPSTGKYYLSITSPVKDYLKTLLFESKTDNAFFFDGHASTGDFALLHAHAGECIIASDGSSRCLTSAGERSGWRLLVLGGHPGLIAENG